MAKCIFPILHYSIAVVFVGGRNIRLKNADVISAQPNRAKERP